MDGLINGRYIVYIYIYNINPYVWKALSTAASSALSSRSSTAHCWAACGVVGLVGWWGGGRGGLVVVRGGGGGRGLVD